MLHGDILVQLIMSFTYVCMSVLVIFILLTTGTHQKSAMSIQNDE